MAGEGARAHRYGSRHRHAYGTWTQNEHCGSRFRAAAVESSRQLEGEGGRHELTGGAVSGERSAEHRGIQYITHKKRWCLQCAHTDVVREWMYVRTHTQDVRIRVCTCVRTSHHPHMRVARKCVHM